MPPKHIDKPPMRFNLQTIVTIGSLILFLGTLGGWIYDSGVKSKRIADLEKHQSEQDLQIKTLINQQNETIKCVSDFTGRVTALLTIMSNNR
jgi:hypothetical protein